MNNSSKRKRLTRLAKEHDLNHRYEYKAYVKCRCKGQLGNFYCYRFISTSVKLQRFYYKKLARVRKIICREIYDVWHNFLIGNKKDLEKAGLLGLIADTEKETGYSYEFGYSKAICCKAEE